MGYYKRLMIEAMQPKEEPPMEVLGWIPVEERLPDRQWDGFSDIVVVAAENAFFLGRYYRCDIGDECHECDADIGERWYIETTAKPTHWMPLPEPPG
jgi:hypothetical protein